MLIVKVKVIEEIPKARTWVDQNLEIEVRVSHIRDKLCVGTVRNLGTSRRIAEIQKEKEITLQTL